MAFIKMMKIPSATFYKRMRNKSFTVEETEKIVMILEMERELEVQLAKDEQDIVNGKVIKAQQVLDQLDKNIRETPSNSGGQKKKL